MSNIAVFDMTGKEVGTMELSDSVFNIQVNKPILHEAVKNFLANQRQGTQSTLTRAEVAGGGRKPWKQKGTGHARQGSTRSPQWTHGGIAFGPKPRSFKYSLNKKVKRIAMKSAFSAKFQSDEIKVIDSMDLSEIKTKKMVEIFKALEINGKTLLVLPNVDEKIIKSARNIVGVKTTQVNTLNVYDILKYDNFVVLKDAVAKIEEVYA